MTQSQAPIVLFCDFGLPYTGQMKARLCLEAPGVPVIDLFHDVPAYDIQAGSVLLAAHADDFPVGSLFLCVVDPGVGTTQRQPGVLFAGGRWFIGPFNGLFEHVVRRYGEDAKADIKAFEIVADQVAVSATFHGRDIFAPAAARLARGDQSGLKPVELKTIRKAEFQEDVRAVIYVDGFGNLMTGIRAKSLRADETIEILGHQLAMVRTFGDVEPGTLIVYENAVGLLEIAASQANAHDILRISTLPSVKIVKL